MSQNVIEISGLWKSFVVRHNRTESLKQLFIGWLDWRRRERRQSFWALTDVGLQVERGQMVGIIGPNGSGKSTLLRCVAGILKPERGEVIVRGRVAPMIEIGVGFHPELTGEENLYLNAALYGLDRPQIEAIRPAIIEYAELEEFIDVPIKNYSTGMYTRLGFSIAVHLQPEVLLVDEILAVGDEAFQQKCLQRMMQLKSSGTSILLVSHDLAKVEKLCDKVYLIAHSRLEFAGDPVKAVAIYREKLAS